MTTHEVDKFVKDACESLDKIIPIIHERGFRQITQEIIYIMVAILDVLSLLLTTHIPNTFFKLPPSETEKRLIDFKNDLDTLSSSLQKENPIIFSEEYQEALSSTLSNK